MGRDTLSDTELQRQGIQEALSLAEESLDDLSAEVIKAENFWLTLMSGENALRREVEVLREQLKELM
jgi:hypothetical protein